MNLQHRKDTPRKLAYLNPENEQKEEKKFLENVIISVAPKLSSTEFKVV